MPSVPSRSVASLLALGFLCLGAPAHAAQSGPMDARFQAAVAGQPPKSAAVYDPSANRLLWGLRADQPLPPASLIKILTAIVVAEHLHPADSVPISHAAAYARADQIAWREGATFSADQVMHGMLMQSSNGAAIALAERVGGSVKEFARLANARARALGVTHTVMVDPSGLDAAGQHASARDLAVLATALLRNEWLAHIVQTTDYPVQWPDGTIAHFGNINRFVGLYRGAVGVKSGYTTRAGNCVVEAAVRNGRTLIVVLIADAHVYDTAARLMDVGFTYAPIGSWHPSPLVEEETPKADEVQAVTASTAPRPASQPAAAPVRRGSLPLRPLMFAVVFAYTARVFQVRRRRIRRRKAQRRARMAATRARVEQMYATRRPDVSPQDVWLTERPYEADQEKWVANHRR